MCSYVFHSSLKTRNSKNTMLMMIRILILILRKKMKTNRKEIKVGRSLVGNLYVSFTSAKAVTSATLKDHWMKYCLDHYTTSAENPNVQLYFKKL